MPKKDDYDVEWKQPNIRITNTHRARLYDLPDGRTLILVSETPDAEGVSVTNGAAAIAAQVCLDHDLDQEKIRFVEHYIRDMNDRRLRDLNTQPHDFALVDMNWNAHDGKFESPRWSPLKPEAVELLCGEKIVD